MGRGVSALAVDVCGEVRRGDYGSVARDDAHEFIDNSALP